ncbi:phospholipase/carboxylesterase [Calothrix sp. NIES-4071]|nr:phospholipase/carboxylesterase [Calothrix sp. NIES-4071]BAZ60224.1 phospholipase/carboxylesterase [Calothrix sp. NIES-4105]
MIRDKQQKQYNLVYEQGRLSVRPQQPTNLSASYGLQPLGLDAHRDALLYVPKSYKSDQPAPLVLMLHGAGGNAHGALAPFLHLADAQGLILLATPSREKSWDIVYGDYGPDIAFIDLSLEKTFSCVAVDPARIAVEGFSDGASYALSIGITNGDLFNHIIAFSPGFMAPASQYGEPRIFISHGKSDNILSIDNCSRKIVPQLQRAGYDVVYQEFNGFHTVPTDIASSALEWFAVR